MPSSLIVWPSTLPIRVQANFGGTLVDLFPFFLKQEIRISFGAQNENGAVQAGTIAFEVDNPDSHFTPDHPLSDYYPYVELGFEVQVSVYWNGGWHVRFTGEASEIKPYWPYGDLSDVDKGVKGEARVAIVASGIFRRLAQGRSPLRSAVYRTMIGITNEDYTPLDHWSWEDGADASQFASSFSGKAAVTPFGPCSFAQDGPDGSAPLVRAAAGFQAALPVSSYTDVGRWLIAFVVNIPMEPSTTSTLFTVPTSGGSVARWELQVIPGALAELRWQAYDSAGVAGISASLVMTGIGTDPSEARFFDRWWNITVSSWQDGGNYWATIGWADGTTDFDGSSGSATAGTHSPISGNIQITVDAALDDIGLGHWAVFTDSNFDPDFAFFYIGQSLGGWTGEQAHERIERLCRELDIPVTIIGTRSKLMGPQQIDTFYNLLNAAALVDVGILHEDREALALVYRCSHTLYDQDPALTLNARNNELTNPFRPVLDDLTVRNDVTVQRVNGSEYRSVVESGPRSVLPSPDGVGTYDEKLTLNLYTDEQARINATWRTWRGKWPGMRYPRISPDLNAAPDIAEDWIAAGLGDLVQVTNLPPQHPSSAVEVLLRGYAETLRPTGWDVVTNNSPAGPYKVGQAGNASNAGSWLQTGAGTLLTATLGVGETSLSVSIDGQLFSTSANLALHPLSLVFGGEVCPVTSISGGASPQTFVVTRTLAKLHPVGTIVQVANPLIAAL